VKFGAEILSTREVVALEPAGSARVLRFDDGSTITAQTVILATGVSYRRLAAPGLEALNGCGVFYGSASSEAPSCTDEDVYVVGGANSAGHRQLLVRSTSKSYGSPAPT
jgi:thioredoxin reductase (NADPH)